MCPSLYVPATIDRRRRRHFLDAAVVQATARFLFRRVHTACARDSARVWTRALRAVSAVTLLVDLLRRFTRKAWDVAARNHPLRYLPVLTCLAFWPSLLSLADLSLHCSFCLQRILLPYALRFLPPMPRSFHRQRAGGRALAFLPYHCAHARHLLPAWSVFSLDAARRALIWWRLDRIK